MKQIAIINVCIPPNTREYWEDVIRQFDRKASWLEPLDREKGRISIDCKVDAQGLEYHEFLALLNRHGSRLPDYGSPDYDERYSAAYQPKGVNWHLLRIDHVYTDAELRAFPLLRLACNRAQANGDYPGRGTEYDFSTGCPQCGRGATQTSPLMVTNEGLPARAAITHTVYGQILVGEAVMEALTRAELIGLELRQIRNYRSRAPLPYWQVLSAYEMPEMLRTFKKLDQIRAIRMCCPACKRNAIGREFDDPEPYTYDRRDVDPGAIPDVVRTWECFGTSYLRGVPPDNEVQAIGQPEILVKPRVFDIFRRLKVKHACFDPVRIE